MRRHGSMRPPISMAGIARLRASGLSDEPPASTRAATDRDMSACDTTRRSPLSSTPFCGLAAAASSLEPAQRGLSSHPTRPSMQQNKRSTANGLTWWRTIVAQPQPWPSAAHMQKDVNDCRCMGRCVHSMMRAI